MAERTPADLLRAALAADPGRPLVTYYDDASAERVELSARTFDNWVAKTANLLVDGLAAQPGEVVALVLPPHWQTAAWLFACWSAGLVVEPVPEPSTTRRSGPVAGPVAGPTAGPVAETAPIPGDADVVVASAGHLAEAVAANAPETVGLSLHALGAPLADPPPGVVDYAVEVRGYGDRFAGAEPPDPRAPALRLAGITRSGAEVVEAAGRAAGRWNLVSSSRVLSVLPFADFDGLLAGLLAPIAAGGSVIICRNLDKTALARRISVEHATAVAGVNGPDEASASLRRLL